MRSLLFLCSLFLVVHAQAGEMYRSVDKDGKVHYGDRPLANTDAVERLKSVNDPAADDSLPYETLKAKENFPVILYVFSDCMKPCQEARDLLSKRGIPFTEKNLLSQEEIDAFRKSSGSAMLPTLGVGKSWLSGFLAEQWNKELDLVGYPKTAPYRAKPVAPRAATEPATPSAQ